MCGGGRFTVTVVCLPAVQKKRKKQEKSKNDKHENSTRKKKMKMKKSKMKNGEKKRKMRKQKKGKKEKSNTGGLDIRHTLLTSMTTQIPIALSSGAAELPWHGSWCKRTTRAWSFGT